MRELSGEEVSPDSFLVSTPVYVKPNYADFDALLERGACLPPVLSPTAYNLPFLTVPCGTTCAHTLPERWIRAQVETLSP
jgi:hypothetical protein